MPLLSTYRPSTHHPRNSLTKTWRSYILMHILMHILSGGNFMRTTINIDNELLDKAAKLTGIGEKLHWWDLLSKRSSREKAPGGSPNWEALKRNWRWYRAGRQQARKMVLVDTSVWVVHLRSGNIGLETLLREGNVVCHPFIVGELACGNLKNRAEILSLLQTFPMAIPGEHEEVMRFIEDHTLMGKGLGTLTFIWLSRR